MESDKYKLQKLEDQVFWESRKEYVQMLNLFSIKKIPFQQFSDQFCELRGSNLWSAKVWKKKLEEDAFVVFPKSNEMDVQLNPKSCGFTKIISSIYSLLEISDPNITFEMNLKHPELLGYGVSEEFLRLQIKEGFLPKLKKYCKED